MKHTITILLFSIVCMHSAISQDRILMIVDVQNQFYEEQEFEEEAKSMVENINMIISVTKPKNIVYIQAATAELSVSLKGFKAVPVLPAPDFSPELNIVNNNIFVKTKGNAFSLDTLCEFIESRETKEIIIVGLMAEKCIYATVKGGLKKGYHIYIIPEAITGFDANSKEQSISKMVKKGAVLLPLNDYVK